MTAIDIVCFEAAKIDGTIPIQIFSIIHLLKPNAFPKK